mmetsp:Transcript_50512/g.110212  ORF Transcript_50512/g.110212 Transcript_50512/m.110212 type:complete len:301 (+) Transcript_50512:673-1575(+)
MPILQCEGTQCTALSLLTRSFVVAARVGGSIRSKDDATIGEALLGGSFRRIGLPEQGSIVQAQLVDAAVNVHENDRVVGSEHWLEVPHDLGGLVLPELAASLCIQAHNTHGSATRAWINASHDEAVVGFHIGCVTSNGLGGPLHPELLTCLHVEGEDESGLGVPKKSTVHEGGTSGHRTNRLVEPELLSIGVELPDSVLAGEINVLLVVNQWARGHDCVVSTVWVVPAPSKRGIEFRLRPHNVCSGVAPWMAAGMGPVVRGVARSFRKEASCLRPAQCCGHHKEAKQSHEGVRSLKYQPW